MEGVIEGKARGRQGWLVGRLPREEAKEAKEGREGGGRKGKEKEENVDSGVDVGEDAVGDGGGEGGTKDGGAEALLVEEEFDDELRESYGVVYVR